MTATIPARIPALEEPMNTDAGPRRRRAAMARRHSHLAKRLATASTPNERLAAAVDHLRSLLAVAPPELADATATAVVESIRRRSAALVKSAAATTKPPETS